MIFTIRTISTYDAATGLFTVTDAYVDRYEETTATYGTSLQLAIVGNVPVDDTNMPLDFVNLTTNCVIHGDSYLVTQGGYVA